MTTNQWFRAAALLSLQLAPLGAQGVRPDPAFRPIFSDGRSAGTFVALQPDGKIVADAGRVRYFPDGTRDPSYALTPGIAAVFEARTAPDGRMFVRYRDGFGNDAFALLRPDGGLDANLDATLNTVRDAIFQPDGKLIVAAESVIVHGASRASPVRFNRDGSLDPTFDAGAGGQNGGPTSLALLPDGKILLGGFFSSFDLVPRKYLVRLTGSGLVDTTFNAAVDHVVTAVLPLPTGKVIAYDGIARNVVLLNSDGSLDHLVGIVAGDIYAFAPAADGRALALGGFASIAGVPRRNLARLNPDGAIDPSFDASSTLRTTQRPVRRFAVQPDGRIIVGSDDSVVDRLIRLNPDGSADLTFAAGSPRPPVFLAIAVRPDGRIYVAGTFVAINGIARPGLARLLPDGTLDPDFGPTAPLVVADGGFDFEQRATQLRVAALPDGGVIVAGTLIAAGSAPRQGVVRFSATGALDGALNPTLNPGGTIRAAAVLPDGRIIVGGEFSTVTGQLRANLATFRPDGTLDAAFAASTDTNGPVRELAPRANGGAFLAGAFTTVAGARRNGLAALNSAGALDAAFVPIELSSSDVVTALAPQPDGGVVIAGPRPTTGFGRAGLRRLKSSGEIDPAFAFPFEVNAVFTALTADAQGRLLAAYNVIETGDLGTTTSHAFVHRFAATGAFDPSFNLGMGFSVPPATLAIAADGTVLAGGAFATLDDLAVSTLVRLVPGANAGASLLNISTRAETASGANVLTAGFVIGGTVPKSVLIRAAGPSLAAFGVTGAATDPAITLFRATTVIAGNDNWTGFLPLRPQATDVGFLAARTAERVGAFPLSSLDAALVVTLAPGSYTAQVRAGANEPTAITLVEVYDANVVPGDRRLLNISSRGIAGAANRTLIAGFVIGGTAPRTVLVRGIGPGLAGFDVGGALADPTLTLVDRSGAAVATNNDWSSSANRAGIASTTATVGAFALADPSKDAALLITLAPGNYTAVVGGANDTEGVALVEVYEIP